jgi:tRNA threonylcarbamoyladenosine biosynthesis protein TsaE
MNLSDISDKSIVTEQELTDVASQLVRQLSGGAVIALQGDLGAGKTTFTKALARALGCHQPLASPTFALERRYALPDGLTLIHQDWYRLGSAEEVVGAGLAESLGDPRLITVIEWPERAPGLIPDNALKISLDYVDATTRRIAFHSGS